MSKYQIGDLVLVKDGGNKVFEIDGVMTKNTPTKLMTVYETKEVDSAGICHRLIDEEIIAKVIIQKPRAKRKSKLNNEPELPLVAPSVTQISA